MPDNIRFILDKWFSTPDLSTGVITARELRELFDWFGEIYGDDV